MLCFLYSSTENRRPRSRKSRKNNDIQRLTADVHNLLVRSEKWLNKIHLSQFRQGHLLSHSITNLFIPDNEKIHHDFQHIHSMNPLYCQMINNKAKIKVFFCLFFIFIYIFFDLLHTNLFFKDRKNTN